MTLIDHDGTSGLPAVGAIPSLRAPIAGQAGAARVMYDPTMRARLRLRDSEGQRLDTAVHGEISDILAALETAAHPLRLHYVRATPSAGDAPPRSLDPRYLPEAIVGIQDAAVAEPALSGLTLVVRAAFRRPLAAEAGDWHPTFDVEPEVEGLDQAPRKALVAFAREGSRRWARCVHEELGPWALDGTVAELRLGGRILPRSRLESPATAALGTRGRLRVG